MMFHFTCYQATTKMKGALLCLEFHNITISSFHLPMVTPDFSWVTPTHTTPISSKLDLLDLTHLDISYPQSHMETFCCPSISKHCLSQHFTVWS